VTIGRRLHIAIDWWRYVTTPNIWPTRWQDRLFRGHVSFGDPLNMGRGRGPSRVTIYGANAMHWAINVWVRGSYWCFHPTTRTFGGRWRWYFYISPDGTPCAATFHLGTRHE